MDVVQDFREILSSPDEESNESVELTKNLFCFYSPLICIMTRFVCVMIYPST